MATVHEGQKPFQCQKNMVGYGQKSDLNEDVRKILSNTYEIMYKEQHMNIENVMLLIFEILKKLSTKWKMNRPSQKF